MSPIQRSWQKDLPRDPAAEWQLQKSLDDKRWLSVHRYTRVIFNGEETEFDNLTGNEKQMLEWNKLGMLEGSDPFWEGE